MDKLSTKIKKYNFFLHPNIFVTRYTRAQTACSFSMRILSAFETFKNVYYAEVKYVTP